MYKNYQAAWFAQFKRPEKIEFALRDLLPPNESNDFAIDLFSTAEQYVLHETQSAKTAVCVTSVLKLYEVTMNKIKLLALDLDGTTLTSKNTLAPAVKSALEKQLRTA